MVKQNLAIARAVHRLVQDTPSTFLLNYQDELERAAGTQAPAPSSGSRSLRRHRSGPKGTREELGLQQRQVMENEINLLESETEAELLQPEPEVEILELLMQPQQDNADPPPAASASTPMSTPASALAPASVSAPLITTLGNQEQLLRRMDALALELGTMYNLIDGDVSREPYLMIPKDSKIRDHWNEWFRGVNGNPSIWSLNGVKGRRVFALHGKSANITWRFRDNHNDFKLQPSSYDAQWKFKKDIVYQVLKAMLVFDGNIPLAIGEENALLAVEKAKGRMTLNAFIEKVKITKKNSIQ